MMKFFSYFLLFTLLLNAGTVLVPNSLDNVHLGALKSIKSKGERETLKFLKESKSSFAIFRSDTLFLMQGNQKGFDFQDYFIVGKLKQKQHLFLLSKNEKPLRSIEDFNKRYVSHSYQDLSSLYFKNLVQGLDRSLMQNIGFEYYSFEEALKNLKNINYIFGFKDREPKGLYSLKLPSSFIEILKKNSGFSIINNEIISDFYVVVKNDVEKENQSLIDLVLWLDKQGNNAFSINAKLGTLEPNIQDIIKEYGENIELNDKIKKVLLEIKKYKKDIDKKIIAIKKIGSKIKSEAGKFKKVSLGLSFKQKAENKLNSLTMEKTKKSLLEQDIKKFQDEKNLMGLEATGGSFKAVYLTLLDYENAMKSILGEIQVKLIEEKEAQEDKEREEALKQEEELKEEALKQEEELKEEEGLKQKTSMGQAFQ